MVYQTRRETRAPSQDGQQLYPVRAGEMVVVARWGGAHLFRRNGDEIVVTLEKGRETILPAHWKPTGQAIEVSDSEYGVLPRRQRLYVPSRERQAS